MAEQADGLGRPLESEMIFDVVSGAHVPDLPRAIPGQRELDDLSVHFTEIGPGVITRTDNVGDLDPTQMIRVSGGVPTKLTACEAGWNLPLRGSGPTLRKSSKGTSEAMA